MKIAVASDLHLEFGDIDFGNPDQAQVLILSGDILVARDLLHHAVDSTLVGSQKSQCYHNFMQRCADRFEHVIFVLGNHEHYHGDFAATAGYLKSVFGYLKNVQVLDDETHTIDDVTFIGGTLWTDMNRNDPVTIFHIKNTMNDFRVVRNGEAKFLPEDAVESHHRFLSYIGHQVDQRPQQRFVVAGHHAPSRQSIKPRYADDHLTNGGYSSDLSNFILDRPQIRLWTHGHTHDCFDYCIGTTRVICNARGYAGYEASADHWQLISVDI